MFVVIVVNVTQQSLLLLLLGKDVTLFLLLLLLSPHRFVMSEDSVFFSCNGTYIRARMQSHGLCCIPLMAAPVSAAVAYSIVIQSGRTEDAVL